MKKQRLYAYLRLSWLILALSVVLPPVHANSQTKEEIIKGFMNALKPGGIVQYELTFLSVDEARGSKKYNIIITEKFVQKDTTIGGYYNYSTKENGEILVYNGFECLQYYPEHYSPDSAFTFDKKDNREAFSDQEIKFGDIVGIKPSVVKSSEYYKLSLLGIKNELEDNSMYSILPNLEVQNDTIIDGKPCFLLSEQYITLVLYKETYLPAYFGIKYPTQSWEATYTNYKHNPANTKNLFSRKAFPKGIVFTQKLQGQESNYLRAGADAPDFEATTLSGDKFKLSDFRGKPVLLMFTETYCPGCLLSYPKINDFAKRYSDLTVLGAYPNDAKSTLEDFVKRKKTDFTIFHDINKENKKYGVSAYPTFFLIDKDGKITYSKVGYSELFMRELQNTIEKELEKKD